MHALRSSGVVTQRTGGTVSGFDPTSLPIASAKTALHRRRLLGVAAVALLASTLPGSRRAAAQTPLAQEPLPQPAEYVSKDGVLKATLNVTRGPVIIGGSEVIGTTYNGGYVGPTLRLKPGERLELTVVNELPEMTNMHFHGLHVSPSGVSDNVFIMIEPGATQDYVVEIPENHPAGTFWYHSHAHPYTDTPRRR